MVRTRIQANQNHIYISDLVFRNKKTPLEEPIKNKQEQKHSQPLVFHLET